jgi:hypothetical protein
MVDDGWIDVEQTIDREMRFPVPRGGDWNALYDWIWLKPSSNVDPLGDPLAVNADDAKSSNATHTAAPSDDPNIVSETRRPPPTASELSDSSPPPHDRHIDSSRRKAPITSMTKPNDIDNAATATPVSITVKASVPPLPLSQVVNHTLYTCPLHV